MKPIAKNILIAVIFLSSLMLLVIYQDILNLRWNELNQEISVIRNIQNSTVVKSRALVPKQNVMFLKTHKTGSSTLQNILVRYAEKNNCFVGLPRGDILFGYMTGTSFQKSMMMPVPISKIVSMLLHHMVFNYTEVSSILPFDAVYITILRDPATQFESVFKYFKQDVEPFNRAEGKDGLKDFVSDPKQYFNGKGDGRFWWVAKNGMFFDLGFDNLSDDEKYIKKSVAKIEGIFDLVLISEYFEISLLLLKDLLHWDIKNIVYLSMNARNQSDVEHVTSDVIDHIRKWNKADYTMYRYFNETFWRRVEAYGKDRLEHDLEEFRKLRKEIEELCVEDKLVNSKDIADKTYKMFTPTGVNVTQYKLKEQAQNNALCKGLIYPEYVWYKKLIEQQYPPQ
uniref:galactosylceramide sulfotransferase-like n=1 Tax=Styela clava TaxID=7725 RepID=UPI00193AA7A3|nr:galactosylceramide sulfotransferase-like [Styela clava]